jgi:hydrogenase-4 component B
MSLHLMILGILLSALSGLPGLLLPRLPAAGQRISIILGMLGSLLGLVALANFWNHGSSPITACLAWPIPGGLLSARLDALAAIFLAPIFLLSLLTHLYGSSYWKQSDHPDNGRKLRTFFGSLTAGMSLLVLADDSILFILGWEIMALSAFFLISTESHKPAVREAGWIYFAATHTSTLLIFALFAVMFAATGTYAFVPIPALATPGPLTHAIFLIALLGFGLKAGLMPLHIWLPGAHAMAPTHVSALMSGVLIKMGIYGLARVTSLLPAPPLAWASLVLVLGVISAILGVAFAIGQHDLKRLLAYHSVENIGIIVMGLGLALIGRSLQRPDLVMLGLAGCLLHVWNHALFKGLLFLSAGSVLHAVHTRELDRLGGLARTMPLTALAFLFGAVAICGLPPLNGFISEWCVYQGLLRTLPGSDHATLIGALFAVPALALVGALAAACFAKAYATVFLGQARTPSAIHAHESPWTMTLPMAVLAGACLLIGLAPALVAPMLDPAVRIWAPELMASTPGLRTWLPLGTLSAVNLGTLLLLAASVALLRARLRRGGVVAGPVWGCAYPAPSPRMQYTASSFAQMLVHAFSWALRPRRHAPAPLDLFPAPAHFHTHVPDPVLDTFILPGMRVSARLLASLRVLQQGHVHAYLLYIFVALLLLLMWSA